MRFGIHVHGLHATDTPPDETVETILEQVRTARAYGFDLVWAGQHYAMERYQKFQPVPLLSRIAAESGDMHLGMNVLLPLAHPVSVAESVATVDALSGGRTILSPIAGYRQAEFDALGVSLSERAGRLAEGVEAIDRLWTEDAVTVDGDHFAFEDVTITPKPAQDPRPPIWIGANDRSAVDRAARLGDAWFVAPSLSESAIRERLDRIDSPSGDGYHGCQPAMRRVFVAESDEAARDRYGPAIRDQFDWHADAAGDDGPDLPPFDQLVDEGYLVGSPETVTDGLVHLHDTLGVDCVVMSTHRPGVPHDAVLDSIRLTGDRVVPAVRERTDAA
jgi:alkanesulfonate monooxygenase SsuD/methylene tetrahydromethanopterin reductase-like flavin-dependent oxidoreductase (luciferase family)